MVAQVVFACGGLDRRTRCRQRVVRPMHTALGRRLLVLLNSHGILLMRARAASQSLAGRAAKPEQNPGQREKPSSIAEQSSRATDATALQCCQRGKRAGVLRGCGQLGINAH